MIALITRDRLGNVYQLNSLLVIQEGANPADGEDAKVRTTSGIQIILSKSPLDTENVGYEKPKPKGFATYLLKRRQQSRRDQRDTRDRDHDNSRVVETKAPEKQSKKADTRRQRRDPEPAEKVKDDKEANSQPQRRRSRKPRKNSSAEK